MDQTLGAERVHRSRSPLLLPSLALLVAVGLVGGLRLVQPGPPNTVPADAVPEDECQSFERRQRQIELLVSDVSTPVFVPTLVARSELVVRGTVTEAQPSPESELAVEVAEKLWATVDSAVIDRMVLPPLGEATGWPWRGSEFLAFLELDSRGRAFVVPGGLVFACAGDDRPSALAALDWGQEFPVPATFSELTAVLRDFVGSSVIESVHHPAQGITAFTATAGDGSEVLVEVPIARDDDVVVWQGQIPDDAVDQVRQPPLVFSSPHMFGWLRAGSCVEGRLRPGCHPPVELHIQSRSTRVDLERAQVQVVRAGGSVADPTFIGQGRVDFFEYAAPQPVDEAGLFVVLRYDEIRVIDQSTLAQRWSYRTSNQFSRLRGVVSDPALVIVQQPDLEVIALALDDGSEVWRSSPEAVVRVEGGVLIFDSPTWTNGLAPESVTRLDERTGEVLWRYEVTGPAGGVPAVTDGRREARTADTALSVDPAAGLAVVEVFFENGRSSFVALDLDTGVPRWVVGDRPRGEVAEIGGVVWWFGYGAVARIDPATGSGMWQISRASIGELTIDGDIADFGEAGSFELDTGRRLRDSRVSPCC